MFLTIKIYLLPGFFRDTFLNRKTRRISRQEKLRACSFVYAKLGSVVKYVVTRNADRNYNVVIPPGTSRTYTAW